MTTELACKVTASVNSNLTEADLLGGSLSDPIDVPSVSDSLTQGTGAGKAKFKYRAQRTLAYNANEALDLTALTDKLGHALDFTTTGIKLIVIQNKGEGTNTLVVGGGTTPFVTNAQHPIPAGGELRLYAGKTSAGWAVTSGTKLLKLLSGGEDNSKGMTYNIEIIG